jgi:L-threonylcarbamoyladenylate synthase
MTAGPEEIAEAVRRLRQGRLVAFPTETVYGLGADALSEAAVRGVFAAKGRPSHNPLIVHVSSEAMARRVSGSWPEAAATLAARFWPGPLSIIVPRGESIPDQVTAGGSTMAVRCPAHPITLALIEAFAGPIVGPSANLSGGVSPTTAAHVRDSFADELVYVLDGGACTGGIESTVVSVVGGHARVLRPGLITPAMIAETLSPGSVDISPREPASGVLESPGMLSVHYAPKAPAFLVKPEDWPQAVGRGVTVSARDGSSVLMPEDAEGYAAKLYAALREADAICQSPGRGVGRSVAGAMILIEHPAGALSEGSGGLWTAIIDRLTRATVPFDAGK